MTKNECCRFWEAAVFDQFGVAGNQKTANRYLPATEAWSANGNSETSGLPA